MSSEILTGEGIIEALDEPTISSDIKQKTSDPFFQRKENELSTILDKGIENISPDEFDKALTALNDMYNFIDKKIKKASDIIESKTKIRKTYNKFYRWSDLVIKNNKADIYRKIKLSSLKNIDKIDRNIKVAFAVTGISLGLLNVAVWGVGITQIIKFIADKKKKSK